ncbi:GvpL/GvpF family gas vesicle protein [Virgibacillus halophilus]|uniref:GvpL/GvpF family gas vesicle protein n=1 Tax=Tigheibacillus halophilus TaxID=361280 RepID=A0ABU5C5K9_9BACI|nr:GvpL/GvpF family gas vesicle protein [Virgibacillus halophilus]
MNISGLFIKKDESVTETWKNGRLLEAAINGYTLIYDEFTRSTAAANNIFLSILEEGVIPLYGMKATKPFERVHPSFSIIFTSNPVEYAGVFQAQDALWDRLITIPIPHQNAEQESAIVAKTCDISRRDATVITSIVSKLRESCKEADRYGPSLRTSLMIGQLAAREDIVIDGSDKAFQQLCQDMLKFTLSRCLDSDNAMEKAEKLILHTCENTESQKGEGEKIVENADKGIYIFCGMQTEAEKDFGSVMVEGTERKIFTIHFKDAAMVAAEVPMKIYKPNKENLLMHQEVIASVMGRCDTVIPISFGNVFKTRADVAALLENLYPQFSELFPKIKGKMEVGLKVIGKKGMAGAGSPARSANQRNG